jgi:hypothetical protein
VENKERMFHDIIGLKTFYPEQEKKAVAYAKALAKKHKAELLFK